MTQIQQEQSDRFRDGNTELFTQRSQLRSELECAEASNAEASSSRRLRMLRRRLDDANAEIVQYNMGLVRSYTRRFNGTASADARAEFESAGVLGLMRAIDSYDPDCGAFGQWAFKPIQREVLRSVRDADHPNLNLGDFEKRPAILRAFRSLQGIDEAYHPSDEEVSAAAGVTVAQVRRVLAPPRLTSLNQPAGDDESGELADSIPSKEVGTEATVMSKLMIGALAQFGLKALDAREHYIMVRRFGLDGEPVEKLADIGESLALSREAVRQIESKALAKLQHPIVLGKLSRTVTRAEPVATCS